MKFGIAQNEKFGTYQGSYSAVTSREVQDSQITLTDYEVKLVTDYFGLQNIHIGNVESNPSLAAKKFMLCKSDKEITLNLVFPKPGKKELRLYLSGCAGFKPDTGDTWFMFVKDEKMWIGSQNSTAWFTESIERWEDEYEGIYQQEVQEQDTIKIHHLKERDRFSRNRKIALKRIEIAQFTCEYDPSHKLFISRCTNKPYLESHHLIPVTAQTHFVIPLDKLVNVCSLCPWCHRAVHSAESGLAVEILQKLISSRPVVEKYSLAGADDILSFYGLVRIQK